MATYYLECEFVAGSYTNITPDCLGAKVTQQLALFRVPLQPHAASFTIDNDTGKYSPRNTSSTLFPNVSVGKNIRLRCFSTSTQDIFNGRITRITADPQIGNRDVSFICESNIAHLIDTRIKLTGVENQYVSTFFTRVCSEATITSTTDNILDKVFYAYAYKDTASDLLDQIVDEGYHFINQLTTGGLRLIGRSQKLNESTVVNSLSEFLSIGYEFAKTDIVNDVTVKSTNRSHNVSAIAYATQEGQITLSSGGNSFIIEHTDPQTNEEDCPFSDVYVYEAAYRTTNVSSEGVDYTSSCSTYLTNYGSTTVVSVYNGSLNRLYVTNFTLVGIPYRKENAIYRSSSNGSSQALFGGKSITQENKTIIDEAFIQNYPSFILWQKQDNIDRISFALKNIYPDIISMFTGDLVHVTNSFLGVDGKYILTEIEHSIDMVSDIEHVTSYNCNRWQTNDWFNLDADHLDIDRLGF